MELAVFLLFALLAVGSAIVVIAHRNPVFSVLSLVVTLFSLAVLFVLAGSPLLAALQVLVYTGAILVLFLFVIMLLNVGGEETGGSGRSVQRWVAIAAAAAFGAMAGVYFWRASAATRVAPLTEQLVSLRSLAASLFDDYLLPFEMVGLLLLVAVIAATVLARRPPKSPEEDNS